MRGARSRCSEPLPLPGAAADHFWFPCSWGAVIRGSLSSVVEHRGPAAEPVARLFAFVQATSSSGALLDLSSSLRHLTYLRVRLLRPALREAAELPSRAPTYELVALVVESSRRHNATVGADVRGCEGSSGPTLGGQFSPRPPHDPDTCLRGRRPVARVSADGNRWRFLEPARTRPAQARTSPARRRFGSRGR